MEDTAKNEQFERLVALALNELDERTERELQRRLDDPLNTALRAEFDEIRQALDVLRSGAEGRLRHMADPPAAVVQRAARLMAGHRDDSPVVESWLDRAGRIIAELVFDSRAQPALAGFRGGSSDHLLQFASSAGHVDMQLTPIRDAVETRWQVRGQFSDVTAAGRDVILRARSSGSELHRTTLDDHGTFAMIAQAGEYDVQIDLDPDPLILPQLALG